MSVQKCSRLTEMSSQDILFFHQIRRLLIFNCLLQRSIQLLDKAPLIE